jgi:hypothetical protein
MCGVKYFNSRVFYNAHALLTSAHVHVILQYELKQFKSGIKIHLSKKTKRVINLTYYNLTGISKRLLYINRNMIQMQILRHVLNFLASYYIFNSDVYATLFNANC